MEFRQGDFVVAGFQPNRPLDPAHLDPLPDAFRADIQPSGYDRDAHEPFAHGFATGTISIPCFFIAAHSARSNTSLR